MAFQYRVFALRINRRELLGAEDAVARVAEAWNDIAVVVEVVVKRRDEYDGRVQRVELTPRGRKMDAAHKYFHQNMVRSITRSMSETEVEQLVQALGKLNDFFERKQEELFQKKKGRNE